MTAGNGSAVAQSAAERAATLLDEEHRTRAADWAE